MLSLEGLDQGMVPWFQQHRRPWLDEAMKGITHAGDDRVVWIFAAVAALVLLWGWSGRGGWKAALILVLIGATAYGVEVGVKPLVKRDRPIVANPAVPIPSSYSFPSGHAVQGAADYLGAALLIARRLRRRSARSVLVALAVGLTFLIGVSRMYLCLHFLTDVLGGWMAGLALALAGAWLDRVTTRVVAAPAVTVPPAPPEPPPAPAP